MQDFLNKSIQSILGKYIGSFVTAFYSIFLINLLGKDAYGAYTVSFLIPSIITAIGSFGLGPSIIYHINKLKVDTLSFFRLVFLFATIISLIYVVIFNYFNGAIIKYVNNPIFIDKQIVLISSLTIPSLLYRKYIRAFLRGFYKIKETVFVESILSPIFMLLGVLVLSLKDYSLHFFIVLPIITNVFAFSVMMFFLRKSLFISKGALKKFKMKDFKKIILFAIKGHLGTIFQKVNFELILLILTPSIKLGEIGTLSLAIKILNIFRGFIDAFINALAPKVSKSKLDQVIIIIQRLTRFLSFYLILLWPFLWFTLPIITPVLYGNEFSNMDLYFKILIPGVTTISLTNIFLLSLTFTGNPKYKTYARLLGFIFSLLFLISFKDQLGIVAGLISISGGYLISAFYSIYSVRKVHKVTISDLVFLKIEDYKYLRKSIKKN